MLESFQHDQQESGNSVVPMLNVLILHNVMSLNSPQVKSQQSLEIGQTALQHFNRF